MNRQIRRLDEATDVQVYWTLFALQLIWFYSQTLELSQMKRSHSNSLWCVVHVIVEIIIEIIQSLEIAIVVPLGIKPRTLLTRQACKPLH